jgi:hypothetical protein
MQKFAGQLINTKQVIPCLQIIKLNFIYYSFYPFFVGTVNINQFFFPLQGQFLVGPQGQLLSTQKLSQTQPSPTPTVREVPVFFSFLFVFCNTILT